MSETGARHTLALMAFFCVTNVYLSRLNLSLAVVPMLGSKARKSGKEDNVTDYCPELLKENSAQDSKFTEGEFDWDIAQVGDLLGSYYYGYICTQIVGGWLSHHFGFKRVSC